MKAFIGLLLLMGVIRKPNIKSYWATDPLVATPIFGEVGLIKFYTIQSK